MNKKKEGFFKKHQLFKIAGLFMIIAAVLTWLYEVGIYQTGELVNEEMIRIGLSDFLTYSVFGHYYYPTHFILIFITAGFYKFLGTIPAYQKLTDNIAKNLKSIKMVFATLVMVLFAVFAGISTEYFAAIALIPFFITILSKMEVHKAVGVASTFGGLLVGILGASYSEKIVGELAKTDTGLAIQYGYQQTPIMVIFFVALLLLAFSMWITKVKKDEDKLTDPFASDALEGMTKKQLRKVNTRPMAILLFVILGVIAIAFIPWETRFNITLFADLHNTITTATLFDAPIFSYLIGNIMPAIGEWDMIAASVSLMISAFVIKLIYSVKFDELLDEFVEGFKKVLPTVAIILMVLAMGLFTAAYPVMSNLISSILKSGTDIIHVFISGLISFLFTSDMSMALRYTNTAYTSLANIDNVALALQGAYGFLQFVVPSSLVLMTGLSMYNVKYTEWLKFIWKFAILVLILIIAVLLVL